MKNNKKIITIATITLLLLLLTLFFFRYTIIITPDSTSYYWYLSILNGINPMSSWSITRGPTFPIILFLITKVFGARIIGLKIGFYILYLLNISLLYLIIKDISRKNNNNIFIWVLYILFIMFNILSIGYSHALLTEAVAPTIIILNTFVIYKNVKSENNNFLKDSLYTIIYTLLLIITWFLKQPYAPVIFFEIVIFAILSIMKKPIKTIIVKRVTLIFIMGISLMLSIKLWNMYLIKNGVNTESDTNNSSFISKGIITGLYGYYSEVEKNKKCNINYIQTVNLPSKEKQAIYQLIKSDKQWCKHLKIFEIENSNIGEATSIIYSSSNIKINNSIELLTKNVINHPYLTFKQYYNNYMGILNLHEVETLPNNYGYVASSNFEWEYESENKGIGLLAYHTTNNSWWEYPGWDNKIKKQDDIKYMKNLAEYQKVNENEETFLENIGNIYIYIYKIVGILILPLFIYSFYKFLKNKENIVYFLSTIIFGSSFLHIAFHAFFGAIIDRYAYPIMTICISGIIILIVNIRNEHQKYLESCKKNENTKNEKGKVLIIIPAYNESENILKVIKEIKKDINYADILVINDCSTDNTEELVKSQNVKCITNVFNMRYAMAIQTGIKYAYNKNYDYVIQMDADGQHIAKEAEKLYKEMLKSNADIIIGSRYLKDMGYPCPLFRRIGTKLFEKLIKRFTNEKIVDPLSGFQCLNRKVIKRYAKMGNYPEFPDANLIIEMILNGYKIVEVPVKMRIRENGVSMHSGIIKPIKYMIEQLYTCIVMVVKYTGKKVKK